MKVSPHVDLRGPYLRVTVDASEPLIRRMLADMAHNGTLLRVECGLTSSDALCHNADFFVRPAGKARP
jgi:hypothetical protein